MRILIADGQGRVRRALKVLLTQQPGLQVVGEASHGCELVVIAGASRAELALVDWDLPGLAETGGLPALHTACPELRIVVLSSKSGVRRAALGAGGDAFVSKGDPPERLLNVVRRYGEKTA